jgi:hypothetical protein
MNLLYPSKITLMPKIKLVFSLILIVGAIYLTFKYTDPIKILAQTNPALAEQVTQKYDEYLKFNQTIQAQSSDAEKYLSYIKILNTQKMAQTQKSYNDNIIDENIELSQLPTGQSLKTLRLSIIRYQTLNQSLYTMLEQLRAKGNTITNSGFSTNNMDVEINKLTDTIIKLESHISTLDFVADQIEQKTVGLDEGLNSASNIINLANTEYKSMFGKVKELINNAQ